MARPHHLLLRFLLLFILGGSPARAGSIKATIQNKSSIHLADTSVTLVAIITKQGSRASTHVEYGPTAALGQSTPVVVIPAAPDPADFQQPVTGLSPDTIYYYRMVAETPAGETLGDVATFRTATVDGKVNWIIANEDLSYSTGGYAPAIHVLDNDISATSSPLFLAEVLQPAHGRATLNSDGTVTYTPAVGFQGADSFSYIVLDNDNHKAIGVVRILNTFENAKGTYEALVGTSASTSAAAGRLRLQVTKSGTLTGSLLLGASRYSIQAALQGDGTANLALAAGVTVKLRIDAGTRELMGTVTSPGGVSTFQAVPAATQSRELKGRYTLLLLPAEDSTEAQGDGYATMKVTSTGQVQISGHTGTGVPFVTAAQLDALGHFPLHVNVASPSGTSLHGVVQFREVEGKSDCDGAIGWSRSLSDSPRQISLMGSRYVAIAPKERLSPLDSRQQNAVLSFGRGAVRLTSDLYVLLSGRRATSTREIPLLALDVDTGHFAGTLQIYGHPAPFRGVLFQKQGIGAGVLKSNVGIGYAKLTLLIPRS